MADKSALRSDSDKRNNETDSPAAAPAKTTSSRPTENSLLADLLSETSNEAQRELDQIKAELQSRKDAELEARRAAESQRRAELDRLREAELRRREAALRSPEEDAAHQRSTAAPALSAAHESVVIDTPKKSSGPIYAVAAVLIAAIATAGWYFTTKEKVQAEAQAAEKTAAAETRKAAGAVGSGDENTPEAEAKGKNTEESTPATADANEGKAPKKPAANAPAAKAASIRLAATESESYERRVPEFAVPQYIKPKRKYRKRRGRRGPGKGKIKIRGLNLGAGR